MVVDDSGNNRIARPIRVVEGAETDIRWFKIGGNND